MLAAVASLLVASLLLGPAAQSVTLAWDANPLPNIAGYKLYYGTTKGKRLAVSGHAMGLRHDPWTGVVHFVDPNFGHFRFPSWHVFREKIKPYWRNGYMDPEEAGAGVS